ncbi:hypothetical protein F4861DRAFT_353583 [Xylaria intraflava]|nr:hypothetical protein F4861DRAFT_353583 [Xylaria intraflava]
MASPQLAIAKVSFSAVLLRADPTSCPRTDIDGFLGRLDATAARCSPPNVQKCKQWIFANIAHSPARVAAMAKYLLALAGSYSADLATTRKQREPSSKRKRLHLLYILNDVLYHAHVRDENHGLAANLELTLPSLFQSAAGFPNSPKHIDKLLSLLDLWEETRYYQSDFINKLRQAVHKGPDSLESQTAADSANGSTNTTAARPSKDTPFTMPTMHGDASAPWYDLPAANWLPVMEPNSTRPMNPELIKPLRFVPGPADKQLVEAVKNLLADVDRIYSKEFSIDDSRTEDIDQMGQRVILDEITGEAVGGETYYGWSRSFCQKMKERRNKKLGLSNRGRGRGSPRSLSHSPSRSRSRSRSPSRGSPRPTFKRRRISATPDSQRSRSRSASKGRNHDRDRDYSLDRRRRRSYDSPGSRSRSRNQSPSRGRSPSPVGRRNPYVNVPNISHLSQNLPPNPPFPHQQPNFLQQGFAPPPPDFSQFPVPPPPPPNYQGPWPPPPPPPPAGGMQPNWIPSIPNTGGGWAAPPPPPPPPPPQQQGGSGGYQQYGRGGRGGYRGGAGGWNRGRGW